MSVLSSQPAGFWQRVKALAFDYLIMVGYLLLVVLLGIGMNVAFPTAAQSIFGNRIWGQVIGFALVTLPVTLYYTLLESSRQQATWGKRRIGLRVVRTDGERLTFARALARTLLKFVPWELSHTLIWQIRFAQPQEMALINMGFVSVWVLIGANLISLWLNKKHQTLYDWLSGTYVVQGT
jgi:uncharacterized RDD family membrane protein YckC